MDFSWPGGVEGRYGVVRGLPRRLALLGEYDVRGTFFVPGLTAQLHPEVGHHGHRHLRSDTVDAQTRRDEIERGLGPVLS